MIDTLIQSLTLIFMVIQIVINRVVRRKLEERDDELNRLNSRVQVLEFLQQRSDTAIDMLFTGWQSEEDAVAEVRN